MRSVHLLAGAGLVITLGLLAGSVDAQRAATAPKFSKLSLAEKKARWDSIPLDISFPDPAQFAPKTPEGGPAGASGSSGGAVEWAKLISPTSIEALIPAAVADTTDEIKNLGLFSARGFKKAQVNETVLAVLFHVVNEYPGNVKWKNQASGLRDLTAEAAMLAANKDQPALDASKKALDQVGQLLKNANLKVEPGEAGVSVAEKIADFSNVMKRMEECHRLKLYLWTGNEGELKKHEKEAVEEAELLATLGQVILDGSYPLATERDYMEYATALRDAAKDIAAGVRSNNFDQARKGSVAINKACDQCHGAYR